MALASPFVLDVMKEVAFMRIGPSS